MQTTATITFTAIRKPISSKWLFQEMLYTSAPYFKPLNIMHANFQKCFNKGSDKDQTTDPLHTAPFKAKPTHKNKQ